MFNIFHHLIHGTEKLSDIRFQDIKQATEDIPLLELQCLGREEMGCQTLYEQLVVRCSLIYD